MTIIVKEFAQPGNRTCKTPDIRLDTPQTEITGMANINGYHQLGLLTAEKCADFLMPLSKVVKSTHKTYTDMHIFIKFIFKRAYTINGSNTSSEIVHLLKVKLP